MTKLKIKKGDTVMVITGKDSGKKGKVLAAVPSENKVFVEGVNIGQKHKKARSAQEKSSIIKKELSIDVSNVMLICPGCGKPSRIKIEGEKKAKVRVCKKCGKTITGAKLAKENKKAESKKVESKITEKAEKKEAKEVKAEPKAAKKPAAKETK